MAYVLKGLRPQRRHWRNETTDLAERQQTMGILAATISTILFLHNKSYLPSHSLPDHTQFNRQKIKRRCRSCSFTSLSASSPLPLPRVLVQLR